MLLCHSGRVASYVRSSWGVSEESAPRPATLSVAFKPNPGIPVRILIISNLYPDARQPTFGTFMQSHVAALIRAGADVQLAAISGVAVHRAILRKYLTLLARSIQLVLMAVLRGKPPEVVEAHIAFPTGLIALPIARIAGARLVLFCHGADVGEIALRSRWHRRFARFVFHHADLLVANSSSTRAILLTRYGAPLTRIVTWSPGIDTDLFRSLQGDPRRDPTRLLYVGRLAPEKGLQTLLRAVARLQNPYSLRIVGDGPERASLEFLAHAMRIPVEFRGGLAPAEVADEMRRAGVLVVPSVYAEPLGLVAIEGMATGTLVVASATGGLQETVVPGRTGWLARPGDEQDLAARIAEAISLGTDRTQDYGAAIRKAAIARASDHDVYRIAHQTLAAYEVLCHNGAPTLKADRGGAGRG